MTAVRSLNKAAQQAETARQAERTEARKAALLALSWELEVNQELLDRQQAAGAGDAPPLLSHLALDAAFAWFSSLPDAASKAIHEAQLGLMAYNFDAEHLRSLLNGPAPDPAQQSASVQLAQHAEGRKRVGESATKTRSLIADAHSALSKALGS